MQISSPRCSENAFSRLKKSNFSGRGPPDPPPKGVPLAPACACGGTWSVYQGSKNHMPECPQAPCLMTWATKINKMYDRTCPTGHQTIWVGIIFQQLLFLFGQQQKFTGHPEMKTHKKQVARLGTKLPENFSSPGILQKFGCTKLTPMLKDTLVKSCVGCDCD